MADPRVSRVSERQFFCLAKRKQQDAVPGDTAFKTLFEKANLDAETAAVWWEVIEAH